jgi:cephalosporin-C deacetylase-like acetyl esterase
MLLGTGWFVQAQPAQKLVNVVVSPDHADWQYKAGEEVSFNVQVFQYGSLLKNVTIDYELGPEYFPTVEKKDVLLKDGKISLKASMKEAGLLRCKVVAKVEGKTYEGLAGALYDGDKIRPTTAEPADFDRFWAEALEAARKSPLNAVKVLLPEKCTSTQDVYEVSFQNGTARVYGILMVPKKAGKYPAVLQVPGAGIRPYNGVNLGDEIISLEIGIHGLSVTLPPAVYNTLSAGALNGYWGFNKNDKERFYYKRVYTGCVRAVDYIFSLPEFDGETIGVGGGSQGGALSIVTAGLEPRIKFLAPFYPALCDLSGYYLKKRAGGWPHFFRDEKPQANELETLAYFDVVNFARRVKVPGCYTWGLNDVTCPPTSMYAAYNVIPGAKELRLYQDTGHWTYPEQYASLSQWVKEQCKK